MKKLLLLGIVMLFCISFIYAIVETFSDSTSTGNLSYSAAGIVRKNISIPHYVNVTSAVLDLKGVYLFNLSWNISTTTLGTQHGSISTNGSTYVTSFDNWCPGTHQGILFEVNVSESSWTWPTMAIKRWNFSDDVFPANTCIDNIEGHAFDNDGIWWIYDSTLSRIYKTDWPTNPMEITGNYSAPWETSDYPVAITFDDDDNLWHCNRTGLYKHDKTDPPTITASYDVPALTNSSSNRCVGLAWDSETFWIGVWNTGTGNDFFHRMEQSNYSAVEYTYTENVDVSHLAHDGSYLIRRSGQSYVYLYSTYPTNVSVDTGDDGTKDYNRSGIFNGTTSIDLNTTAINNYLSNCTTLDGGYCIVPISFYSSLRGDIEYSNLNITYEWGISNCTNKGYPTINFSIRNESTDALMSGTMDFVFDYSRGIDTGNFSTEVTQTNFSFCIYPNWTWVESDIMVSYTVDGTDYNYFAYQINLSNATKLVNLYATSGTTQVTFNVKDTGGDNIEYAYIHIEKYDAGTNTYKEVEVLRTGNDGNAYGEILLGDWYRFTIRYQGTAYLVDGPIRQIATTKNFRIDLLGADWFDDYDVIRNVAHSLTFNNATLKFSFTWNDPELEITSACLRVRQRNATRDTLINESCTTAHSGTINMAINTTGSVDDKTFVAVGYFRMIQSPITEFVADVLEKSFDYEWMIYDSEGKGFGLFMTALVTIALILIGATAAGPIGAIVGGVLGIFVMSTLNIFYLSTPIMITIVIVGGVVAYRINNAK